MRLPACRFRGLCVLATVVATLANAESVFAQGVRGETLDPASFGPGVVETIEVVLERVRADAARPQTDPRARAGRASAWMVPSRLAPRRAHSGERCAINRFGDTRMRIGFHAPVDVEGAWIAAAGVPGSSARAVQVIGYRSGSDVARTAWFEAIGEEPAWLAIDMTAVERIEFVARESFEGAAWFSLDDLCFVRGAQDASRERVVVDFEDVAFGTVLTGSGYRGLEWEEGHRGLESSQGPVHAPRAPLAASREAETPAPPPSSALAAIAAPPAIVQSFAGPRQGDPGSPSYPPDTCGAVGLDHFVVAINNSLSVYSKSTGAKLFTSSLNNFFGLLAGADPRILFDPHSQRWFLTTTDFIDRVHFAMSITSDPLGPWFKTSIVVSQGEDAGTWPDYPTLGVDANGVYLAAYMVGGNFNMAIFAIDKAPLLAAAPALGTVTAWRNLVFEWAIQPCITYGTPPAEYFVSRQTPTLLRIRAVLPPLTAPTLVEQASITVPNHADPPDVPALGAGPFIHTIDMRPINAIYRNGSVWTAHGIRNTLERSAVRWYELDPVGSTALQVGTVSDDVRSFHYGSIAVSANGDVALGFSGSSPNEYVAAYVAGRRAIDPSGATSAPILLKAGEGPYVHLDQGGLNRWGDYSLTSVDPVDDTSIWSIQEYAAAGNRWGTWIAKLSPGCPGTPDCNGNGVADACDLAGGLSVDNNASGVPDECEGFDGSAFCFGDGSLTTVCPCAAPDFVPSPSSAADAGCANSFDLEGARLRVFGLTSPDSLELQARIAGGYGGFAYVLKGDAQSASGVAFGDGVRCVDGSFVRFGEHHAGTNGAPAGEWSYPNAVQSTPVSVATGQVAGATAYYQLVYRNAIAGFCTPQTFNASNAFRVAW